MSAALIFDFFFLVSFSLLFRKNKMVFSHCDDDERWTGLGLVLLSSVDDSC